MNIGAIIKNSFQAILRGEFIMRLKPNRYLIHITYFFFLCMMAIWMSIAIETSMAKVESNKKMIEELEIINAQKTYELAKAERRSNVAAKLNELGSKVKEAERPATVLK